MDCRRFKDLLPGFLAGEVSEPLFGEAVEHEAVCPACHRLASEAVQEAPPVPASPAGGEWRVASILDQTEGSDCRFIQLRLAEALDEDLPADLVRRVQKHLAGCPSCRRMRDLFHHLPEYYEALPALRPGRAFTEAVLRQTLGPQPGFRDVLRALWRKPEAIWEAAAACAIIAVLLFGGAIPSYQEVTAKVQGAAEQAGITGVADIFATRQEPDRRRFGPVLDAYNAAHGTWNRFESWAVGASGWMRRVGEGVRTGNQADLLQQVRAVLEPMGLYPEADEGRHGQTEPGLEPGTEPVTEPGTQPGAKPGIEPGIEPGTEPGPESGPDLESRSGTDAEPGRAADAKTPNPEEVER